MRRVCHDTVVGFGVRYDVGHQVLLEERHLALKALGGYGAVGHDDNHRLHLSLSQQVVKDVSGASHSRSRRVVVAATMDEVEHGQALSRLLVACRSPDVHAAHLPKRAAVVPTLRHGAVLHVLPLVVELLAAAQVADGDKGVVGCRGALPLGCAGGGHREVPG